MQKKLVLIFASLFIGISFAAKASNITVSGNVSGIWGTDTIKVTGNIEVPYGKTLTISPGCKVFFEGYYQLIVWGKLVAVGTSANPIRFESSDTTGYSGNTGTLGSWAGIKMGSIPSESSLLEYCIFKYMKGSSPIDLANGTSNFNSCWFQDNKANPLVYIYNSGNRISNSVFSNNSSSRVVVIDARYIDTTYFENNTVVFNEGVGLYYYGYVKSACVLTNNIFWGNDRNSPNPSQITHNQHDDREGFDTSSIIARNCIIENGTQLPFFNNSCFDQDPKFLAADERNYSPAWDNYPIPDFTRSIAIDNGYYLSKPDADSSRRDIGAISFFRAERRSQTWVKFKMDTQRGYQSSLTVRFTNVSNILKDQNTAWLWEFGDGSTSDAMNPTYTYTQAGIFSVKLKATDQNGHIDSLVLNDIISVFPGTPILEGAVQGILRKTLSPYYVYGDIYVPDNSKLTIEPGVEVLFMGSYSFDVYGSLYAQGTPTDTIVFKANDTTGMYLYRGMNIDYPYADFQWSKGWLGIHFVSDFSDSDTCKISFVKIRDVRIGKAGPQYKGALKLHKIRHAEVRNSLFTNNFTTPHQYITVVDTSASEYQTAGICSVGSNPIIENNTFEELYQYSSAAIYALYADSIQVLGNRFRNVANSVVAIKKITSYRVENNIFEDINGICLILQDDTSSTKTTNNIVKNNSFLKSGRGIIAGGVYGIDFTNNIFKENVSDIDVCLVAWGDKIYINNNLFYKNSVTATISNVGAVCINLLLTNSKTGVIANNTLIDNRGFGAYQSVIYGDESILVANNIVRNISGVELQATRFTTSWFFTQFSKAYNNNVKGGYANGSGNFDKPEMFVDALSGDFSLPRNSTSINTGRADTSGLHLPAFDLFGNPRIDTFLNRIDIGCSEYITNKPSKISLSSDSVKAHLPKGTPVASINTVDPDITDTHNYSLVNIPNVPNNNANFTIGNDILFSNIIFDSVHNPQKVSIRSKDNFGAFIDSSFTIWISPNYDTGTTEPTDTTVTTDTAGVAGPTDIQEYISAYPNPFKSTLTVKVGEGKKGAWRIYDVKGRLIKSGSYQNKIVVNLPMLSNGIYFLRVEDKNKRYIIKIFKE
jgi:PKD repeat protein